MEIGFIIIMLCLVVMISKEDYEAFNNLNNLVKKNK